MLSTRGRGTEKNKRVLASDATWGFLRANPNKLIDAGDSFGTQHLESMLPKFAEWSFTKIPKIKSFDLLYTSWRWTMSKRSGDKIHLSANQYRDICNKLDEMLHLGVTENQHTVNDIIDPLRIPPPRNFQANVEIQNSQIWIDWRTDWGCDPADPSKGLQSDSLIHFLPLVPLGFPCNLLTSGWEINWTYGSTIQNVSIFLSFRWRMPSKCLVVVVLFSSRCQAVLYHQLSSMRSAQILQRTQNSWALCSDGMTHRRRTYFRIDMSNESKWSSQWHIWNSRQTKRKSWS